MEILSSVTLSLASCLFVSAKMFIGPDYGLMEKTDLSKILEMKLLTFLKQTPRRGCGGADRSVALSLIKDTPPHWLIR